MGEQTFLRGGPRMNKGRLVAIFLFILCGLVGGAYGQTESNENSIRTAKVLYAQHKPVVLELRVAAATGDAESQFMLGERLSDMAQYVTPEARYWYERAAWQGNIYAMFRLAYQNTEVCRILSDCSSATWPADGWKNHLLHIAHARAEQGDAGAMAMLYQVTGMLSWLEKAAESGDSESQWLLSHKYKEGKGYFWLGQRSKAVARLLRQSAEGGYPKAMWEHAVALAVGGDVSRGRQWLLKVVEISYVKAVTGYADYSSRDSPFKLPRDLVKAYGLNSLLVELDAEDLKETSERQMRDLEQHLTPAEIAEALAFAEQWKKTHPPLSFYPTKLGL